MLANTLALVALVVSSTGLALAEPERVEKRQNLNELIQLASLAGISLPTDPAVLLQLGPIASNLAAALPTSSVLAVLETAAPPSFISQVVHDPTFARSFETAFAAGSSPSWFNALPTDVKSYLHTYSGFGGIASAANLVVGGNGGLNSAAGASITGTETARSGSSAATNTGSSSGSSVTSASKASATSSSSASSGSTASKTSGTASSSSAKPNNAAHLTEAVAASLAGVIGILGLAIAL